MRSQNLEGSISVRSADKLPVSRMPKEWLDAGSWRLPSGQALAEYALQSGFLAPLLFRSSSEGVRGSESGSAAGETVATARFEYFEKGSKR